MNEREIAAQERAVLAKLEERGGWRKKPNGAREGGMCLAMALNAAGLWIGPRWELLPWAAATGTVVQELYPRRCRTRRKSLIGVVMAFNDHEDTEYEDVLAVIRRAGRMLRERKEEYDLQCRTGR
jgi:hypothetical protein